MHLYGSSARYRLSCPALKHVPIVEAQPLEGLFTNALGTRNVAEVALEAGVAAMVLVSTDKAVNPTRATNKRMAEMFCQAMDLPDFTPDAEIAALINAGGADRAPPLTVLEEGRQ